MSTFQGKDIHATKVRISGGAQEVFVEAPEIDQIVEITLEGRVTGVDFRVNESSGELEKHVRVKMMDIDSVGVLSYPRGVTMDGTQVNPDTGEIVTRGA